MKILKRIIYSILGILIAETVALVGIILYAEYSGNRFSEETIPALAELDDGVSRLVYDENGDLVELPRTQTAGGGADAPAETATGGSADTPSASGAATADSTDSPAAQTAAGGTATAASASYSASDTGGEPELPYVMDLGSALFHTADCPYAANIAADKRSEMTTTGTKIMNAGYNPCTNCHPDTAAAAAANTASAASVAVSNELN